MDKEIVLYTTHCPQCEMLKLALDKKNVGYEVFEDTKEMVKMGLTTVPMLSVDGKILNFKDAVRWVGELNA